MFDYNFFIDPPALKVRGAQYKEVPEWGPYAIIDFARLPIITDKTEAV